LGIANRLEKIPTVVGAKYVENFQQQEKLIDHTFDTIDIGIE